MIFLFLATYFLVPSLFHGIFSVALLAEADFLQKGISFENTDQETPPVAGIFKTKAFGTSLSSVALPVTSYWTGDFSLPFLFLSYSNLDTVLRC